MNRIASAIKYALARETPSVSHKQRTNPRRNAERRALRQVGRRQYLKWKKATRQPARAS